MNNRILNNKYVDIVIYKDIAYLSSMAYHPQGFRVLMPPVISCQIVPDELITAIQKMKDAPIPNLPDDFDIRTIQGKNSALLKATGIKSWKQMVQLCSSYEIVWTPMKNYLSIHVNKHGAWMVDPTKIVEFPADYPIENIVEIILRDYREKKFT